MTNKEIAEKWSKHPSLAEFLDPVRIRLKSTYLNHPLFKLLYVRQGKYMLKTKSIPNAIICEKCIQISLIESTHPKNGAFKSLIKGIEKMVPDWYIIVELVHNSGFRKKLPELGFERIETHDFLSFVKIPIGAFL